MYLKGGLGDLLGVCGVCLEEVRAHMGLLSLFFGFVVVVRLSLGDDDFWGVVD